MRLRWNAQNWMPNLRSLFFQEGNKANRVPCFCLLGRRELKKQPSTWWPTIIPGAHTVTTDTSASWLQDGGSALRTHYRAALVDVPCQLLP